MKLLLLQLIKREQPIHKLGMTKFYAMANISRQGFAQALECEREATIQWSAIESLILPYRKYKDRRAGSRSLFYNLDIKDKFGMGVNQFEQLLSDKGLCLAPLRTKVVTTKSSLQSWNYSNLLNKLKINGINQVVVGDITYIYLKGQRFFLLLLTDVYSARIVGHCISRNMRALDAVQAAQMWIKLRKRKNLANCIHHTDGGGQYFSDLYMGMLRGLKVQIRMSRAITCLENGYAEQRNGLIKHHLLPTMKMIGKEVPTKQIEQLIHFYNYERKQEGLKWLSPVEYEKYTSKLSPKPEIELYDFKQNGFRF